jgi:hypothetical protein
MEVGHDGELQFVTGCRSDFALGFSVREFFEQSLLDESGGQRLKPPPP